MISYICHVRCYVISYITYVKQKNLKLSLISYRDVFEPLDGHSHPSITIFGRAVIMISLSAGPFLLSTDFILKRCIN